MNSVSILHLIFIVIILLLPLSPLRILPYVIMLPSIITLSWVIFDGCFLSNMDDELDDSNFSYTYLKKIFPTIKKSFVDFLWTFYFVFATLIIHYRIKYNY